MARWMTYGGLENQIIITSIRLDNKTLANYTAAWRFTAYAYVLEFKFVVFPVVRNQFKYTLF